MNYWLTTHWPRRQGEDETEPPFGVWVPDKREAAVADMAPGDLVFIYESLSGRPRVTTYANGTTTTTPCERGRGGVIVLAEVVDRPSEQTESGPEEYTDGTSIWWRYMARTKPINSAGFIPRTQVAVALGYSPDYGFRGFGDYHSGVKKLSQEEYDKLFALFRDSSRKRDGEATKGAFHPGGWTPGGEGPEHLRLKNAIAADPEALLGEKGLSLYKKEYAFPTADQADIILRDRGERYVAVEVEVDCPDVEVIGPLQSMKYRALLAYLFDRRQSEVRAMLVAHTIPRQVRERCERHGIECHEVPRSSLPKESV